MYLPDFRRGVELTSTELNKLSDAIRSAAVTSVIGGTFSRTPGGTCLIIDQQVRGGGSEGGGVPCPFEVTDASEGTTMKVQIGWGLIWQQLPTGMFPSNNPPLKMTVTETCYVYSKITFNTSTLIPSAVAFTISSAILQNTASDQYNLIARVFVNEDADSKTISGISNICQQPFPSPCSLAPTSS